MTLQELYEAIGGSYEEAIGRLQSDALVGRFIVKLLEDNSCSRLISCWKNGDEAAAFEAAHTAKGVCANLSVSGLAALASEITEALRPGNEALRANTDVDALVARFEESYDNAITAIAAYVQGA